LDQNKPKFYTKTTATFILLQAVVAEENEEEIPSEAPNDPVSFHLRFNQPRPGVLIIDQAANNLLSATNELGVSQRQETLDLRYLCYYVTI
jgi:hypothetical protein